MTSHLVQTQYSDAPEACPSEFNQQPNLEMQHPVLNTQLDKPQPKLETQNLVPNAQLSPQNHQQQIICLRVTTWILSALLAVVLVGAAIGGGVGGSIAAKNARE